MSASPLAPVKKNRRNTVLVRPLQEWSDSELLQRFALRQDGAAFAVLVDRHGALVQGVCRRVLQQEQDAEDAFQATFLILARKAGSIQYQKSLPAWLYKVAFRLALRARANKAQRQQREEQLRLQPPPPLSPARDDVGPVLDEEVQRLPEKYRIPVLLCYLQGRTNEEAARALDCPTGTVKIRLLRAREILRQRLLRRGIGVTLGVLLATAVAEASAAVPPPLTTATVRACAEVGNSPSLPEQVLQLVTGMQRRLGLAKLKLACALLLTVALLTGCDCLYQRQLAQAPLREPATSPEIQPTPQYQPNPPRPVEILAQAGRMA